MNKKILFSISFLLASSLPVVALAQAGGLDPIFTKIKDAFVTIGGLIVVIGWVIAGILYLTSVGGERLVVAKKALIACVIGTALIVLAASVEGIIRFYLQP